MKLHSVFATLLALQVQTGDAFSLASRNVISTTTAPTNTVLFSQSATELESSEESTPTLLDISHQEAREKLLELIPKMTGQPEEFRLVESYVNTLEDTFSPPQTLDFLNLAMAGEWQFLFTTNQLGRPSPLLRMTELTQVISVKGLEGKLINACMFDMVDGGSTFEVFGKFSSTLSYNINQGARMTLDENEPDLSLNLSKGSKVPSDTENLVGLIHRAMPTEMFDPSDLAMDTTYLDPEIRIVRYTGKRHEGVRNIFMRKGAIEINPDL
ncbi:hypothetical protein CTEN210_09637 [Chaetoceros tenuissimus]|uniref:Plastid lipid-associated protein/fibrillin conserved domain-containing protein n=1 Tax=Chaetoceros tenuissimus TaxID=426638 RepID=A0AAD3H7K0_9STRA|nr:hypothetical protein CTEN210_09637 [Chaetoceros tenuissimus]